MELEPEDIQNAKTSKLQNFKRGDYFRNEKFL